MQRRSLQKRAHVVGVNMGYGHARAAFGLADLCKNDIVIANDYPGIPAEDKKLWGRSRELYESISRLQSLPWIGHAIFELMDRFQRIPPFYPRRDLSRSNFQIAEIYYLIKKHNLGKHLVEKLSAHPVPLICTFFLPAYAAEYHGYPGDIYIVVCDADMFRTWAPLDPKSSRIEYFAPTGRVVERLKLYGVPANRIHLTGFPLPPQTIGTTKNEILKPDLLERLGVLDPQHFFRQTYQDTLAQYFGRGMNRWGATRPPTITFSIGGAGAHKRIAWQILHSIKTLLLQQRLCLNLEAGTHLELAHFFTRVARNIGLQRALGKTLFIHGYKDRDTYFREFTETLRTTDILWTKPSELSFYTGLGLPIIMAPPLGSQEEYNKDWLERIGGGIAQQDPRYTHEWLMDWIQSGALARLAWNGYTEAPTHGTHRIASLVTGTPIAIPELPFIV